MSLILLFLQNLKRGAADGMVRFTGGFRRGSLRIDFPLLPAEPYHPGDFPARSFLPRNLFRGGTQTVRFRVRIAPATKTQRRNGAARTKRYSKTWYAVPRTAVSGSDRSHER